MSQRNNNFSGLEWHAEWHRFFSHIRSGKKEKEKERKKEIAVRTCRCAACRAVRFRASLREIFSVTLRIFRCILIRQGASLSFLLFHLVVMREFIMNTAHISHSKPPVWSYMTLFICLRRLCTSVYARYTRVALSRRVYHLFIFRLEI